MHRRWGFEGKGKGIKMYYLIADKFVTMLKKKGYVREERSKFINTVMQYLCTLFINIILAAGIGHTFQIESQLIVFSIFYSVLQVSHGGIFLKLDIKNSVIRWILAVVLICVAKIMAFDMYTKWMMVSFLLISLVASLVLVPYRTNSMSLPDEIRKSLQKRSIITISALCVLLVIGLLLFENEFMISAIIGVFVQCLSLLPTSVAHKQMVIIADSAY